MNSVCPHRRGAKPVVPVTAKEASPFSTLPHWRQPWGGREDRSRLPLCSGDPRVHARPPVGGNWPKPKWRFMVTAVEGHVSHGYVRDVLPVSILDLAPIVEGGSPGQALRNSIDLVRHAERLGYNRYWVAEHHNLSGIASAATSVVIAHLAEATESIRVGAGGIMLPNHAPLVVAEQFGTLEALHPGRIDLGLGRAPGTDQVTLRALRGDPTADTFPQDVLELQALLGDPLPGQTVFAIPGVGSHVPLWILGSSLYGAQLAAALGLPYAFASHFAPDLLLPALEVYRARFQPSAQLQEPYVMVAVNVIAADDDVTGERLFTSAQQAFTNIIRGTRGRLPPPIDDIEAHWSPAEQAHVSNMLSRSYVGSADTVREGLESVISETEPDELIVAAAIHDHSARVHSYEILATVRRALGTRPSSQSGA